MHNLTASATPAPTAHRPAKAYRINADHLRLALVARRARPGTRWAAMSNGGATSSCKPSLAGSAYYIHTPPMFTPLTAGRMQHAYDRVRSLGRGEVLRTWRSSLSVLKVEFSTHILRSRTPG